MKTKVLVRSIINRTCWSLGRQLISEAINMNYTIGIPQITSLVHVTGARLIITMITYSTYNKNKNASCLYRSENNVSPLGGQLLPGRCVRVIRIVRLVKPYVRSESTFGQRFEECEDAGRAALSYRVWGARPQTSVTRSTPLGRTTGSRAAAVD